MKTIDFPAHESLKVSEAMQMVWEARKRIAEKTQNMSDQEFLDWQNRQSDAAIQQTKRLNPQNYDFSFLQK